MPPMIPVLPLGDAESGFVSSKDAVFIAGTPHPKVAIGIVYSASYLIELNDAFYDLAACAELCLENLT